MGLSDFAKKGGGHQYAHIHWNQNHLNLILNK